MASETTESRAANASARLVKSSLDFGGGLFLLAVAAVGYIGAFNLPFGQLSGIGSGLLPKTVSVLVALFGLLLVLQGLFSHGDRLEQWAVRGPVFVLGAVLVFAATIRPWGLIVAGPLAIIISSLADKETRPIEIVLFATVMTAACIGLFKILLRLPIPVFPPGYGPF
jgi:putative tricarboxylic transport membrane protein